MSLRVLLNRLFLKGLALGKIGFKTKSPQVTFWMEKKSTCEICPKCATVCISIYDHREVIIKDCPLFELQVLLKIKKRRFWCKACSKPFTESVKGIKKWGRQTDRYCRYVFHLASHYANLSSAQKHARCSSGFIYKLFYKQLAQQKQRENSPWPESIGIDEHFFGYHQTFRYREYVTMFVDHHRRRIKEVVAGRAKGTLQANLAHIPGREKVRFITMDLSETYRSFIKEYFPNALRIADKFHVIRLLGRAIKRAHAGIKHHTNGFLKKLLLANGHSLKSDIQKALMTGLKAYPDLQELYLFKERLHKFYRMPNYQQATLFMKQLTDDLSFSRLPDLQTLRKTLLSWREEILNYFKKKLTNGLVEGLNNKAKQIKRRAYGFRSFQNYRLRLVTAHQ